MHCRSCIEHKATTYLMVWMWNSSSCEKLFLCCSRCHSICYQLVTRRSLARNHDGLLAYHSQNECPMKHWMNTNQISLIKYVNSFPEGRILRPYIWNYSLSLFWQFWIFSTHPSLFSLYYFYCVLLDNLKNFNSPTEEFIWIVVMLYLLTFPTV